MSTSSPSVRSEYHEREDKPAEKARSQPTWWLRLFARLRLYLKRTWFIVGRWQEEPIGVAVPLIATFIILFAPQMPDMFAGMAHVRESWWNVLNSVVQALLFGFFAAVLGFFSWYWTLAALGARIRKTDEERKDPRSVRKEASEHKVAVSEDMATTPALKRVLIIVHRFLAAVFDFFSWYWTRAALIARVRKIDARRKDPGGVGKDAAEHKVASLEDMAATWARERAPRAGLIFSMLIAASPLLIIGSRVLAAWFDPLRHDRDVNRMGGDLGGLFLGFAAGIVLIVLVLWFVRKRQLFGFNCYLSSKPPVWMWRFSTTSTFAAAPFGWPFAVGFLAISGIGVGILAALPSWIHGLNAPAAALLALGLVIAPLVVALALLRDVIAEVLERAVDFYPDGWFTTVMISSGLCLFGFGLAISPFSMPQGLRLSLWVILLVLAWLLVSPALVGLLTEACSSSKRERDRPELVEPKLVEKVSSIVGLIALLVILFGPSFTGYGLDHYAIRTTSTKLDHAQREQAASGSLSRPSLEEALDTWYAARRPEYAAEAPMPVIIVATEGGASRAAVWTLSAMRRLDEETKGDFGRYLFAISSVSGGSLGAVTYTQAAKAYPSAKGGLNWQHERVENGLNKLATDDLLSASIATYFLNDTISSLFAAPLHLVGIPMPDRAAALEAAFEQHWSRDWLGGGCLAAKSARMGLLELYAGSPNLPHLLLNGTDVDTGRRVITSTIRFQESDDLFAASDDLLEYVGSDIPASTTVTNTARFPYISPAGRFWHYNDSQRENDPRQIVDGGYFENYGARTAAELARKIRQISLTNQKKGIKIALVPIIVVISNDGDGLRSNEEKQACEAMNIGGETGDKGEQTPCFLLRDVTVTCDRKAADSGATDKSTTLHRSQERREAASRGVASELFAPVLGLYATRAAHGQDAQYIVRRFHCPGPDSTDLYPGNVGVAETTRMIHMALPKADPAQGEAAPLNWVLNENVRVFLLDHAPKVEFNNQQAQLLQKSLEALRQIPVQKCTSEL